MTALEYITLLQENEENCECLIHPNGEVEEPKPSHINRLAELAGGDTTRLHGFMEKNMEPLFWLVEFTGCMSVWETRVVSPAKPTPAQLEVLEELHDAALLSPRYLLQKADESYQESVRRAKAALWQAYPQGKRE